MGTTCSSCQSSSVATAKLVLQDGRLQEFSYPVKVSYLLHTDPASFICNSDEMEFDDVVSAVGQDEELQLGQLYFALPLSKLKQPLHAADMAALAVKASSAMMRLHGDKCGCRRKKISPAIFSVAGNGKSSGKVAATGGVIDGGFRRGQSRGKGRKNSAAFLCSIPE